MRIVGAGEVVRLMVLVVTGVYIGLVANVWFFYWRLYRVDRVVWRNLRYVSGMASTGILMSGAVDLSVASRIVNEHPPVTAGIVGILIAWTAGCASLFPLLKQLRYRWVHPESEGGAGGIPPEGLKGGNP